MAEKDPLYTVILSDTVIFFSLKSNFEFHKSMKNTNTHAILSSMVRQEYNKVEEARGCSFSADSQGHCAYCTVSGSTKMKTITLS